jgi:hypothetical protein
MLPRWYPGILDRALAGLSIRTRWQLARPVLASQGENMAMTLNAHV